MANNNNVKRGPSHGITVIFLICFCYFLDSRSSEWLPNVRLNTLDFSVSSARHHLQDLVALGPRVAGTPVNEIETVKLLISKLKDIQTDAPAHVKVEIEEQHPSGDLYLGFLNGITNIYKNVSNVVVRISWPEVEAQHGQSRDILDQAVLVNAHFDSVAGSPGASDDGIGVAVMIEATRSLVMGEALKKPIIMLFNGAEESNHHAAHGFITSHKWAKSIKYLINLEAIGAGGREMVFQCNSGELMSLYGKVAPYPHAHAVAHELFKHLIWRAASTDWKTILSHGQPGMHGLDTAYLKNGYVYHTHHDRENILQDGTFLNTGANVLQLSKALSLSTEEDFDGSTADSDHGMESAVFFDILGGWAFFSYRGNWVYALHSLVVIFGLSTVLCLCSTAYTHVVSMLIDEVKCLLAPIVCNLALGLICHIFCPMTWYQSGKGYALVMFLPPAAISALWVRGVCVSSRGYSAESAHRQSSAIFMWAAIASPMILCGLVSAYPMCFWIGFSSLAMVMYSQVVSAKAMSARAAQAHESSTSLKSVYLKIMQRCDENIMYSVCLIPCTVPWFSLLNIVLTMVIPLTGKSGTIVPGDIIVAAVIGALVALPAGSLMANHVYCRMKRSTLKACVAFVAVILFYTVVFNNTAYSTQRPKRLWLQHVERFIDSTKDGVETSAHDHGIWVSAFDGQGLDPLASLPHTQLQPKYRGNAACTVADGDCFMSFPWYFPVTETIRDSMYIPTKTPPTQRNSRSNLQLLLSTENLSADARNEGEYRFVDVTVIGSSHMALVIKDNARGNRVVAWNLKNMHDVSDSHGAVNPKSISEAVGAFKEQDMVTPNPPRSEGVYYVQIGFGLCPGDVCSKVIRLKVKGSSPVEFSAYSHYVDTWEQDESLQQFHQGLPKWAQNAYFTQFPSVLVRKSI